MMVNLKLLVGITGSVGVLNIPSFLPFFKARYPHMQLIMTKSAESFVSKEAISLFVESVHTELFPIPYKKEKSHIWLAEWADLIIILPATAHLLAQIAHGLADTLLTATILAHSKSVLFFPNMNPNMWNNPSTKRNVSLLREYGHIIPSFTRQKSYHVLSGEMQEEALSIPPLEEIFRLIDSEAQKRKDSSKGAPCAS